MIEYLEQLVAERKYPEALKLAEQILREGLQTPRDLLVVNSALAGAYCRMERWEEALVPGDMAMRLAQEIGEWDYFGKTAIDVSVAYDRLGRCEEAVSRTYDCLAHLRDYREAAAYEMAAWFNLGKLSVRQGRPTEAVKAFSNSLKAAVKHGDHRYAHGVRQALIDAHLRAQEYKPIPKLLAQSGVYLRRHRDQPNVRKSWFFHMRLRSEFALATGRPLRAMLVAIRGLERSEDANHHAARFHMLLAQAAQEVGNAVEAVGHTLAAQEHAGLAGRPDLQAEASDLLYQLSRAHPDAVEYVEEFYLLKQ